MNIISTAIASVISLLHLATSHAADVTDLNLDGTVDCSVTATTTFTPSTGRVSAYTITGASGSTERHLWVDMKWSSNQRLSWFHSNSDSSFELDTHFYNYNDKAWAKSFSNSVFSNLPLWYIDTQLFDGDDEKVVTIGSANADTLQSGKQYYYGGKLETDWHPSANPDSLVKLQAQRGRIVVPFCGTGWQNCVFSCQQFANNVQVLKFQNSPSNPQLQAPGCRTFQNNNPGTGAASC
ncbi:MAG: hypothetical protein AB8B84_12700 [Granulosicoccus sp.]